MTAAKTSAVQFALQADPLAEEILAGLRGEPKHIAPKYFYDQTGAALFDAITRLDEYYVTRLEAEIFALCQSPDFSVDKLEKLDKSVASRWPKPGGTERLLRTV